MYQSKRHWHQGTERTTIHGDHRQHSGHQVNRLKKFVFPGCLSCLALKVTQERQQTLCMQQLIPGGTQPHPPMSATIWKCTCWLRYLYQEWHVLGRENINFKMLNDSFLHFYSKKNPFGCERIFLMNIQISSLFFEYWTIKKKIKSYIDHLCVLL